MRLKLVASASASFVGLGEKQTKETECQIEVKKICIDNEN